MEKFATKKLLNHHATPEMHRYTTLWKINFQKSCNQKKYVRKNVCHCLASYGSFGVILVQSDYL